MYSKSILGLYFAFIFALPAKVWSAEAKGPSLSIQPNKCVALRKGRTCYADITVKWQTKTPGDYCLISNISALPLACWKNKQTGNIKLNFESTTNQEFSLVFEQSKQLVYSQTMVVTWLHKSPNRRRRWRLF